jgi:CubicO group peptidase (beta-lactamase class C family)
MNHILLLWSLLLWSLLTSAATARDLDSLVQDLDGIRDQQKVAAYAVVITSPNAVLIADNRGTSSLQDKRAITADAYFRIGSITKSFIALAALIAEQNELLTLNQPVSSIIGETYFSNPWRDLRPVTLEQLLQHSAGLPDMSSRREFNHNTPISNSQGLALYAEDRKVLWPPGQYYSYSNTGFGLAGLVLEKSGGENIHSFLTEHLFTPLNMYSATLEYTDTVRETLVPGFDRDGTTPLPYWHMIFPSFGALNIQPREMANVLQLYLNRGRFENRQIISENNMRRMELPSTTLAARSGLKYGYGLGIYNWYKDGHEFFGHGGDGDGYLARFGYSQEAQLAYFIVINSFQHQPINDMQSMIETWIVNDLPEVHYPEPFALPNPAAFTGRYTSQTSRFARNSSQQLDIFLNASTLYIRKGNNKSHELIPVTERLFRRRNESAATIAIIPTEEGLVFVSDEGNFLKR